MNAQLISKLRSFEPKLRAQGICGLYLFGSQATRETHMRSDIDLMFDIASGTRFSLFDQARISRELSEALQADVDFVPRRSLHPLVKARAEAERITVFQ